MRNGVLLILASLISLSLCQADPIVFPSGYIPFASLDYITHPDKNGYSLVVGETTLLGASELLLYFQSLPPVSGNQQYANGRIELAPGVFFSNVLIPTSSERYGDFRDFGGAIYDPFTGPLFGIPGQPFAQNIIPMSRFGEPFAFRIGPNDPVSTTPEPNAFLLFAIGVPAVLAAYRITRHRSS